MTKLGTAFTPISDPATERLLTLIEESTGQRFKISIADFLTSYGLGVVQSGARLNILGMLNLPPKSVVVSGGAITVTGPYMKVDTENMDPTDDITQINGGIDGDVVMFTGQNGSRNCTFKTTAVKLDGSVEFTLSNLNRTIILLRRGSAWVELSRSSNPV